MIDLFIGTVGKMIYPNVTELFPFRGHSTPHSYNAPQSDIVSKGHAYMQRILGYLLNVYELSSHDVAPNIVWVKVTHDPPNFTSPSDFKVSYQVLTLDPKNFEMAGSRTQICRERLEGSVKAIKLLLENVKSQSNHRQINLSAYLVFPVQRLPRYKLLLESLLKVTPFDHEHYASTCQAFE